MKKKISEFRTSNNAMILNHSVMVESNSNSTVEKSGYIPAKVRIENMMLAGQRLVASRNELYDDPSGENEDIPLDPTRNPGFDMADASQLALEVDARLKASQKAQEAQDKEKNKKAGESPPKSEGAE